MPFCPNRITVQIHMQKLLSHETDATIYLCKKGKSYLRFLLSYNNVFLDLNLEIVQDWSKALNPGFQDCFLKFRFFWQFLCRNSEVFGKLIPKNFGLFSIPWSGEPQLQNLFERTPRIQHFYVLRIIPKVLTTCGVWPQVSLKVHHQY